MYDIIIIGTGFSGAYAALELAKDGYKILVLESGSHVIGPESTSYNQCYKLHSGVHYFGDAVTARKCLLDSITCAKQWPEFLLGEPNSLPRRNRHYIMSNSLFNVEEARKIAAMLSQTYANLVKEDPKNQVFGDPENFIKEVGPEKYDYVAPEMIFAKKVGTIEKANVALALDVGEPQVDIKKIKNFLHHSITHTKNITALFNHEVTSIEPCQNDLSYKVTVLAKNKNGKNNPVEFRSKGIVNCAWQNIETLNKTAGLHIDNLDNLLIRMKISLLAELPEKLKNMDTCIFSLGPYCSITNQYDGTAVLTYEPATNIGHYFQNMPVPEKMRLIKNQKTNLLETEIGQKIAQEIVAGCAIYVPDLKHAKVLEIRIGYVKMYLNKDEKYSIYDRCSPIHRRREDGVIVHDDENALPCYISASGMKMTYTQSNAEKIRILMREEMEKRTACKREQTRIRKMGKRLTRDLAAIQEYKKFIVETKDAYEQANMEKISSLQPTLLKNPITLEFFVPETK